jgi:hypothetical protein
MRPFSLYGSLAIKFASKKYFSGKKSILQLPIIIVVTAIIISEKRFFLINTLSFLIIL